MKYFPNSFDRRALLTHLGLRFHETYFRRCSFRKQLSVRVIGYSQEGHTSSNKEFLGLLSGMKGEGVGERG